MEFDRDDYVIPVAADVQILVRTGGERQLERYAVILQARIDGEWCTIRLVDNHLDQHHMHRYDGTTKGAPEHFAHGPVHEVIPQAIDYMREHYQPIIDSWTR